MDIDLQEDLSILNQFGKEAVSSNEKLVIFEKLYNVSLEQINGQRILRHIDCISPPKEDNCEIFIGKLPRDILEDELYPLFSQYGKIYEMRLMMDFSGSNRGFCFVKYTNAAAAVKAVHYLNKYEIRPGCSIGVVESVNNCKLLIEHLPINIKLTDFIKEVSTFTAEIKKVSFYKDIKNKFQFAVITYKTHRDAAMARRQFVPRKNTLFGKGVSVDWADPNFEPVNVTEETGEVDDSGNIVIQPHKVVHSKTSKTNNCNNTSHKADTKINSKSKMSTYLDFDSHRKVIREEKLVEMQKKKCNRNPSKKKGRKESAESVANYVCNGSKTESNSSFDDSLGRKYDSCFDLSYQSPTMSDTSNTPSYPPMNFNLFEDFKFSLPSSKLQSSYQTMYERNEHSVDDLNSYFQSNLYLDESRSDEYNYFDAVPNSGYNYGQNVPCENIYQYCQPAPYGQYHLSCDKVYSGMYPTKNMYLNYQSHGGLQSIASIFASSNSSPNERYCHSPVYCKALNDSNVPTCNSQSRNEILKPLGCQDFNQNQYGTSRNYWNYKHDKLSESSRTRSIPSLKSVGISKYTNKTSNWTPRIVENDLENIPPGARPIRGCRN